MLTRSAVSSREERYQDAKIQETFGRKHRDKRAITDHMA